LISVCIAYISVDKIDHFLIFSDDSLFGILSDCGIAALAQPYAAAAVTVGVRNVLSKENSRDSCKSVT